LVALYVVSAEEAVGKTAICAGIGRYLLGDGKKAGFVKLAGESGGERDAAFMKQVLGLSEDTESACIPVGDAKKIKEACDRASQGKDVVIVEGMVGQNAGDDLSKAAFGVAEALNARVIVVEGYSDEAPGFTESYKGFGKNLLGVMLNKVPVSQMERMQEEMSTWSGGAGINFLGALPEDRGLSTLTVGELADSVQGKILNNAEKSADLVEHFMLGAMVVDSGLDYFGRKTNKAVLVRSDRPDMQLAALETSTRCLVISNGTEPSVYNVQQKAEDKGIPVILTEGDTNAIIADIEEALGRVRFGQEKKLPKLAEILHRHLKLEAVV
jgi:BioD-like phosphotransacetylase family protein